MWDDASSGYGWEGGRILTLMSPQTRFLSMQPEVRFPDGIRTHLPADPLVFSIFVCNGPVAYRVDDVHALLAHLAR